LTKSLTNDPPAASVAEGGFSAPVRTHDLTYAGETVTLADLPEYAKFYRKLVTGVWEPRTFKTLARNLDRDTVFIDIGAWIGVTPFWAAHRAKAVIAVEPDPKCIGILQALKGQASNVTILEGALSPQRDVTINAVDGFGSSETSVLALGCGETVKVRGLGLGAIVTLAGNASAFVKIDVEGYEFALADELTKLRRHKIRGIQLALHPQLYERTLSGDPATRRLRTLWSTWRLVRALRAFLPAPSFGKYRSLGDYLVRGIMLRRIPKGTDAVFEHTKLEQD
jgi:FkbM family methyltransferase